MNGTKKEQLLRKIKFQSSLLSRVIRSGLEIEGIPHERIEDVYQQLSEHDVNALLADREILLVQKSLDQVKKKKAEIARKRKESLRRRFRPAD